MAEFKEIKVLDKGFVRLVDRMGDDSTIVRAARVSYQNGTKTVLEDASLINYLMRHRHTSPFEMVEFTFDVKLPKFVARQWIRHRTANVNEVSARYSELPSEYYVPEISRLQKQSNNNKQGSSNETIEDPDYARKLIDDISYNANVEYGKLLDMGLSRELSRVVLPVNQYTQWIWKCDLHNLFNFLRLRLDSHAQYEIRVYAEAIYELIREYVPISCEAFEDHILNSRTFSRKELEIIFSFMNDMGVRSSESLIHTGMSHGLSKGASREFASKFEGIPVQWGT